VRRILFVANGHGENAIAARIAMATQRAAHEPLGLDLLPLVGEGTADAPAGAPALVGPRRTMPSGGLVAMGNVGAFARDARAGFARLFAAQWRFLRTAAARYDAVVAVGDVYALGLAFLAGRRTVFVGTAKSVYVAPYGRLERTLLRRALRVFVRDEPTARMLCARRVAAQAPGNVIVDLIDEAPAALPGTWLGILPGSREAAYADGLRLARVARELAALRPSCGGLFSLAPTLDPGRFRAELAGDGWDVSAPATGDVAFEARAGTAHLVAWHGSYGALLRASVAVLGQAGTANEQAAAFGLPVIALGGRASSGDWYRTRQRRLLGEALQLVAPEPRLAATAVNELLGDEARLRRMGDAGRKRMGPAGGAAAIARAILDISE